MILAAIIQKSVYHRRRTVGKMYLKLLRSLKHLDFVKAILRAKIDHK